MRSTTNNNNKSTTNNNKQVWIKDDKVYWIKATVVEPPNDGVVVVQTSDNGRVVTVRLSDYRGLRLPLQNDMVPYDLLHLPHVHEAGVFEVIAQRYEQHQIYTRSGGDSLIAVNPFQSVAALYDLRVQQQYSSAILNERSGVDVRDKMEPHLYEISALAYKGLRRDNANQSILLSGDSGSGKTTSYKLLLHHLATLQQSNIDNDSTHKNKNNHHTITQSIETANPILEAFGNAATIRNDNSSRFGKYTLLQYNHQYQLVGSQTTTFLLETARLSHGCCHERNYHVFYQLLDSSDHYKRTLFPPLASRTATDFEYLRNGNCELHTIEGVRDGDCFAAMYETLQQQCQFIDTTILFRTVAAVLYLGNLHIVPHAIHNDHASIVPDDELEHTCDLLGLLDKEELIQSLTVRSFAANNEDYMVPLTVESALTARDALAKAIYLGTFDYLVEQLNRTTTAVDIAPHTIGLLDIFGFESLETNRFGQLCINYANEKLQQQAVQKIFQASKLEYEREGVPFHQVDYQDNERVLRMIEGRSGLVDILLEECFRPKGNHRAFVQKLLNSNSSSKYILPVKGREKEFQIVHFAGTVTYQADDFVVANQDKLPDDVKRLCQTRSTNPIVTTIFSAVRTGTSKGRKEPLSNHSLLLSNGKQDMLLAVKEQSPFTIASSSSNDSYWMKDKPVNHETSISSDKPPIKTMLSGHATLKDPNKGPIGDKTLPSGGSWIKHNNKSETIVKSRSFDDSPNLISTVRRQPRRLSPSTMSSAPLTDMKASSETPPKRSTISEIMGDTVWTKYHGQLSSLLRVLSQSQCRYVRCIKPNEDNIPGVIDQRRVIETLRCAGIVATVRLSRSIYPAAMKNSIVRFRFGQLWDKAKYPSKARSFQNTETRRKKECEALLESVFASRVDEPIQGHSYVVGKTRTYFATGVLEYLEAQRVLKLDRVAVVIQCFFRGYLSRKVSVPYREQRLAAATLLQTRVRVFLAVRTLQRLKKLQLGLAAVPIQRLFRGRRSRKKSQPYRDKRRTAVMALQSYARMFLAVRMVQRLKTIRLDCVSNISQQCNHYATSHFSTNHDHSGPSSQCSRVSSAAILIQKCSRGHLDRLLYHDLRRATAALAQVVGVGHFQRGGRRLKRLCHFEHNFSLVQLALRRSQHCEENACGMYLNNQVNSAQTK